jgi:hypothetical protein
MDRGVDLMSAGWREFETEIARWRDAGRAVEFWWRDDDATRPAPALARLLAIAAQADVPLALAVIPEAAAPELFQTLGRGVTVLQHGVDHRNRAAPGEKKTEFPAGEPVGVSLARLAAGHARLTLLGASRTIAVLAPPWNRFPAALVRGLAGAGLHGLSTYGARATIAPAPGVIQVNTHVDIVAWRGGRGFVGDEAALALAVRHLAARRTGSADSSEPTGWLTHHADHDEAAWTFLMRLCETSRRAGVVWRRADDLFAKPH